MKFNKLAGFAIASIVLFGSVGQLAINAQPAQAQRAGQSVRVAAKSQSLIASGSFVTTEQDTPPTVLLRLSRKMVSVT